MEASEQTGIMREQALERLKKRRDFQGHVVAYAVVNVEMARLHGRR